MTSLTTRRVRRTGPAVLLFMIGMVVSVAAHHSHGNYNMTEYTILKGVVKEVHWINPHTWIYIEVKDATGEPTMWDCCQPLTSSRSKGVKLCSAASSGVG